MQRHFLLLVAMISWSIVLALNGSQLQAPSKVCIPYIKLGPGIQMELVRNGSQVPSLLGQAGMEPGDSNRQIMREQQYLDFILSRFTGRSSTTQLVAPSAILGEWDSALQNGFES